MQPASDLLLRLQLALGPNYEDVHYIDSGGMAHVYAARNRLLGGRDEAVKVLDLRALDPVAARLAKARFDLECEATGVLSNPCILQAYTVGEDAERDVAWLTMEFAEEGSLAGLLRRGRPEPAILLRLGIGIARGLAFMHAKGFVHRDLKPSNVLLTEGGRAVLADMGLARSVDRTDITAPLSILGTDAYMAPEQRRGDRARAPADMYAFGLVLREMLTGTRNTEGLEAARAYTRLRDVPPGVSAAAPPRGLEKLIDALLQPDPERRPEAKEALERLERMAGEAAPSSPGSRRRAIAIAAGVVALLLVGWWGAQDIRGRLVDGSQAEDSTSVAPGGGGDPGVGSLQPEPAGTQASVPSQPSRPRTSGNEAGLQEPRGEESVPVTFTLVVGFRPTAAPLVDEAGLSHVLVDGRDTGESPGDFRLSGVPGDTIRVSLRQTARRNRALLFDPSTAMVVVPGNEGTVSILFAVRDGEGP